MGLGIQSNENKRELCKAHSIQEFSVADPTKIVILVQIRS